MKTFTVYVTACDLENSFNFDKAIFPTPCAFSALAVCDPMEFHHNLWQQKTRVSGLSCKWLAWW